MALQTRDSEIVLKMVEFSPMGILLVDGRGAVEYANAAACQIMGVDSDDRCSTLLSKLLGDVFRKLLEDMGPEHGTPAGPEQAGRIEREFKITTNDGTERIVEMAVIGRFGKHCLCYINDVSVRKQLEVEFNRQDTFFHDLINSSVDGIIASDMKGNIILFNTGAEEILGYTREEAIKSLHVSRLYPEGEARQILKRMRSDDFGGKGKLLRHELTAITKDGRKIPMSISGGIIYDHGNEIATFGIFTDLRDMRKIEEDLQQTHEMLVQSERMAGLGRLAAGIAHEINNPMSGIMLYSNLIKEQLEENHPAMDDLEIIVNEAERCKRIVTDLLEFSHQTGYEQQGIDVNQQIEKSLGVLDVQPLFHNIEIVLELKENLSRIWGNPIRLSQVFINIIVNAAQAMDGKGRIEIISRHRSNGGIVEACISDTGPGMDKETQSQVFDPFFTTKTASGGTGLGLSVSYAIVREHKGSIRVESELGEGTTFILRFPVYKDEALGD